MSKWGPFKRQPNILIICSDQQRTIQHFPKGWAEKNLPWLTHLKKTGVTFSENMCSSTACSPSRSAIFSSTYPTVNGVLKVGDTIEMSRTLPMGGSLTTLGQVISKAGYQMIYKGKWHLDASFAAFSELRPSDQDRILIEDEAMDNHYSFPGWTSPDMGTAEANDKSEETASYRSPLNSIGGGTANNDSRIVNGPLFSSGQKSAVQFLQDYDPKSELPFCLVVSMANPHDIWVYPNTPVSAGYTDEVWLTSAYDEFELPESYFHSLKKNGKPKAQRNFLKNFQGGRIKKKDDPKNYVKFYAYLHTLIDELTGDLVKALRSNNHCNGGLEQDTLIIRMSDHGEMGMAQYGLRQKENNCYKEALKVPMIFSNPLLPQGKKNNSFVGLIDLLPTLAEITGAGIDPGYVIQGNSYAESILQPSVQKSDQHFFATDDGSLSQYTSIRAIVGKDYKYAVYYKAEYDSSTSAILNYNGNIDSDKTIQYELYDYSTHEGRIEVENLLSDPDEVENELLVLWQKLHSSLTLKMKDTYTMPDSWKKADPLYDRHPSTLDEE